MKIIKIVSILTCALALAMPQQSKASSPLAKIMMLGAIGTGAIFVFEKLGDRFFGDTVECPLPLRIKSLNAMQEQLDHQLWVHLLKGSVSGVATSLANGANANVRRLGNLHETTLGAAINLKKTNLDDIDTQFKIVNLLLAHGARDDYQVAYRHIVHAYHHYAQLAHQNESYSRLARQAALKYVDILALLGYRLPDQESKKSYNSRIPVLERILESPE